MDNSFDNSLKPNILRRSTVPISWFPIYVSKETGSYDTLSITKPWIVPKPSSSSLGQAETLHTHETGKQTQFPQPRFDV